MDDDLVDHDLGEQGRGQRHELDGERGQEDVAEHLAVLEQFGEEPTEPEMRTGRRISHPDPPEAYFLGVACRTMPA